MKTKLSLLAAAVLTSTTLQADAASLQDAFKNGSINGDFVLYTEYQSNNSGTDDAGFSSGSVGLNYETDTFHGVKLSLGLRANHDFDEVEEGDFDSEDDPKALLHTANISYTNDNFAIILGRQEMDLEWIGDFHEAYTGRITALPNTTIVLGHTDRIAVADPDAVLEEWSKINGNEGANFFDITYEGIKNLALNAYYYNVNDVADWYGIKANFDTDMFGAAAHYASSDEDTGNNGSILHVEAHGTISDIALAAGYITTDKEAGIGSMDTMGDTINPLEDGNQIYTADADTFYLSAAYEIDAIALSAIYGKTDYGNNDEKEFNVTADFAVTDTFSLGALYVNVSAENSADDYDRFALTATYTF